MRKSSRLAIEELWRRRLDDAKVRAYRAHQRLEEIERDISSGAMNSMDGQFAFEKAIRTENLALAEYNRVLSIFSDLILRGIIPAENTWRPPGDEQE
jgi:hypothetical protein